MFLEAELLENAFPNGSLGTSERECGSERISLRVLCVLCGFVTSNESEMEILKQADPNVYAAIQGERQRQQDGLELIAA